MNRLSRRDLLFALGILHYGPEIDALTNRAYVDYEDKVWRGNLDNRPHGHPWATSFHASSFPGEKACGRKALYTMLDTASAEPSPPMLRATGEVGKAVESQIIFRWGQAGLLVAGSCPLRDGGRYSQVGFEDEDLWLTGSCDAILGIPDFPYALPVDIKSKAKDKIEQMRVGALSYDPKHYAQVQAYCYLATKFYDEMGWKEMGLLPPVGGIIYYVSRDNPRFTKEFFVDINWDFINAGIENLKIWRESYLSDTLPDRPKEWRWTEDPCHWCNFKKFACKPDYKAKVTKLSLSNAHEFTKSIRPDYNPIEIREEVESRWI